MDISGLGASKLLEALEKLEHPEEAKPEKKEAKAEAKPEKKEAKAEEKAADEYITFDDFEKQLVSDVIRARLPEVLTGADVFV